MDYKNRQQLATKHGISVDSLHSRIKDSWSDFPQPVYKIGTTLYYNEDQASFYIKEKLEKKEKKQREKVNKLKRKPDNSYFGGQKFLKVFIR